MIEITLLPEEMRKKESVKIALPEIPIKKTMIMVFAAIFGLQMLFTIVTFFLRFQEITYNRSITSLKTTNKEISQKKMETVGIRHRLKEARTVMTRKFYWTSLLSALSNSMTKGVWLRAVYVTDQELKSNAPPGRIVTPDATASKKGSKEKAKEKDKYLVLEGSAVGSGQETAFIGKFLKQLKDDVTFNALFQDIKPSNINQRRIKEYDVYDFTISCKFRKDKL